MNDHFFRGIFDCAAGLAARQNASPGHGGDDEEGQITLLQAVENAVALLEALEDFGSLDQDGDILCDLRIAATRLKTFPRVAGVIL